ncbi:Bidirectional sugar transporter like [Actinidia chinensis var. chinensis]|uniref:Bidirectional sugar transporter SWEET n=1 Tax=Actinidia chinensis var. chinensis TaxID=1590841 RepID=A0A2R6PHS1_ACTCC|nr:Bidirectional sugar transporter like [Actinidia chinensis var. chinensis]
MVSRDAARTAVGVLGNIISVILFMSPLPTFAQIWKKGSVEQFSSAPYLATLINCGLWVLYGLPMVHPHSILVVTINGFGTFIEFVYLLLFLWYSDRRKRLKVLVIMLVECVALATLALLVLTLTHSTKLRSTIVGSIAMLGNVMMYASPLSVMRMVVSTKSVEYMPLSLSLASFANGICWTIYALIRFDPFIVAPNGLGTLLGLAQIILYDTFYKSTKRQMLERQSKVEMGLAETAIPEESKKISKPAQKGHVSRVSGP